VGKGKVLRVSGWILAGLALCLALAACAPADEGVRVQGVPMTSADLVQGHVLYQAYCAGCHGDKGQGQFPAAPLEPSLITGRIGAPPHDETGHSWHHSDDLLVRYVLEGGFTDPANFYPMPAFGWRVSVDEARQIVGYIMTLWTDEQRMMQRRTTQDEMEMMAGQ
jgi:mono/diheme cytochrome c family protein